MLAALAAAAALAGCAGGDPMTNELLTASIASGGARKSVCVISAIGDTFSLQKIGITVFGNALDKYSIEAWGIDGSVTARIGSQLGQRFDVRRIDHPRGAFAALDEAKSVFASDYKDYRTEIRDIVPGLVAPQKCDLGVIVTKSVSMYSSTNQMVRGLGIVDVGGPLFARTSLFALWEMRVYDGKTFAVLAHKRAPSPEPLTIRGPHRTVDQSWWPNPGQLAQNARLKQAMLELLEPGLDAAVGELFASQ